jgi:hypothetical protein
MPPSHRMVTTKLTGVTVERKNLSLTLLGSKISAVTGKKEIAVFL